jgi:osmotically-inducible protein OsmY
MEVEVKDGVVTLKGKVEYDEQKIKAGKLTRKVSGVQRVDNQLVVVGKGNPR